MRRETATGAATAHITSGHCSVQATVYTVQCTGMCTLHTYLPVSSVHHCIVYPNSAHHCIVYPNSGHHCIVYPNSVHQCLGPIFRLQTPALNGETAAGGENIFPTHHFGLNLSSWSKKQPRLQATSKTFYPTRKVFGQRCLGPEHVNSAVMLKHEPIFCGIKIQSEFMPFFSCCAPVGFRIINLIYIKKNQF